MENFQTWRELLRTIVQDTYEKQKIVQALGINSITLSRWVNNASTPRPVYLRQLISLVPLKYRTTMIDLVRRDFPNFAFISTEKAREEDQDDIPSEFYGRVFNAYAVTPTLQRAWSIMSLILQQALGQLDPQQVGMALTLVQCMPPSLDDKICSLRERFGSGTYPWSSSLEPYSLFLGAESLAGYVVSSCHPRVIQNSEEQQGVLPAHWVQWERSAAAYPIFRSDSIAGCLVASCMQPDYFTAGRQMLLQQYAELLVMVFEPQEFYEFHRINLHVMPYYLLQEKHMANFRQRVSSLMKEELRRGHALNLKEAELLVWQQIERELWQLPPYMGKPDDE